MDNKGVPIWISLGGLVLFAALVVDFAVVIYAAVTAH